MELEGLQKRWLVIGQPDVANRLKRLGALIPHLDYVVSDGRDCLETAERQRKDEPCHRWAGNRAGPGTSKSAALRLRWR
jgi:hypothetical protein